MVGNRGRGLRGDRAVMIALAIDLAVLALTAAMAWWGFRQGLTVRTFALAGFGVGAILGSRFAPLVLDGGLRSSFAPVLALPAALVLGGLLAALLERVAFRNRRRLDNLGSSDGALGAAFAGLLGLAAAWLLGAAVAQVGALRDPVESSAILGSLTGVLPPPGPVLAPPPEPIGRFPTFKGPKPRVPSPNPVIARDPEVRAAARSVVKIVGTGGCGAAGTGSGWVARDGLVVTNAHVVAGTNARSVQLRGTGLLHPAEVVHFNREHDIALLETRGIGGVAPLVLARDPRAGTSAAILGFPGGRREIRPARLGNSDAPIGRLVGETRPIPGPVTSFAGRAQPGNSGGPIVDTRGRVLTTVFAKRLESFAGYGVPNPLVRRALRRVSSRPVDTGPCER